MEVDAFQRLRARVEAYGLDRPDEARPFSWRLREDRGWSSARAARAIAEYRRFVVLAVAAGHPVSPPPEVDEVWHLHLTDTRRYWQEFCPEVLGQPLHHEPSRGGPEERQRLEDQYAATVASYQRLFGGAPPRDVWPAPRVRVRRARLSFALQPLVTTSLALVLAGCAAVFDSASPDAVQGPEFIGYYVLAVLAVLLAMIPLQGLVIAPRHRAAVGPADVGAYELAYLAEGPRRVVQTALLQLLLAGHVELPGATLRPIAIAPPPEDAAAAELEVYDAVRRGVLQRRGYYAPTFPSLRARLEALGLLPDADARRRAWWVVVLLIGPLAAVGLIRLYFGIYNHRPTGFLITALILAPVIASVITNRVLKDNGRRARLRRQAEAVLPRRTAPGDALLLRCVAIWGVAAIAAVEFAGFRQFATAMPLVRPNAGSDGGSGCSGGGSGCGGGCGGCGG